jgi:hypothetical protein
VFLLLERDSSRDRRITTVQLADVVVGSEERYIKVQENCCGFCAREWVLKARLGTSTGPLFATFKDRADVDREMGLRDTFDPEEALTGMLLGKPWKDAGGICLTGHIHGLPGGRGNRREREYGRDEGEGRDTDEDAEDIEEDL